MKEAQDLFNTASALCSKNHPNGPRLAIVTNAGGVGIMATNRLLRSGGELAKFSAKTMKALDSGDAALLEQGKPRRRIPVRRCRALREGYPDLHG